MSFLNQHDTSKQMNRDGVIAPFRRVGGFAGMLAAMTALNAGDFIKPTSISQLDGSPRWSMRDLVTHIVADRSTFEASYAAALLQAAEGKA